MFNRLISCYNFLTALDI